MDHDSHHIDFCDYEAAVSNSPVFAAVMQDNVPFLTQLLKEGHSINIQDKVEKAPLHFAVNHKRKRVFDFMLKLEDIDLNPQDCDGVTPLMLAVLDGAEYYVFELLKNGANVNVVDHFYSSALHYSTSYFNIAEALVAKGADMNLQDFLGHTPLHVASIECACECVFLLLLHGADPHILDIKDNLPFSLGLFRSHKMKPFELVILEWLYNFTFDEQTNQISLRMLNAAMLYSAEYFNKFLGKNVEFEPSDLDKCYDYLYKIDPSIFYLFMKNYKLIVHELVFRYHTRILQDFVAGKPGSKEICSMLCENDFFVDYTCPRVSFLNNISLNTLSEDTLGGRLLYLLSYGFILTETDLQLIYKFYGFGKLFKMLLHMDIFNNNYNFQKPLMPHLIYNMHFNIDRFFKCPNVIMEDFDGLVNFFAYPLLAEYGKRVLKRQLSPVPSLLELSRNCARQNIIKTFRVQNFSQFFTIVKRLPIADLCKAILFYERAIYPYPELC